MRDQQNPKSIKPSESVHSHVATFPDYISITASFARVWLDDSLVDADEIKQEDKVTIVVPGMAARLCPYPNCGQDQYITRIPQGIVLEMQGIMDIQSGKLPPVKWFEVTYKVKRGWISIFNTNKVL